MKKSVFLLAVLFSAISTVTAFAGTSTPDITYNSTIGGSFTVPDSESRNSYRHGSWQEDSNGRWWLREDGTYPANGVESIDDDDDYYFERYEFDANGYLITNRVDQFGPTCNEKGQMLNRDKNEIYRFYNPPRITVADIDTNFEDENYNRWGISRAAIDMLNNTREVNNSKYGKVSYGYRIPLHGLSWTDCITYKNNLAVTDIYDLGDHFHPVVSVDVSRTGGSYKPLIKFYFDTHTEDLDGSVDEKFDILNGLGIYKKVELHSDYVLVFFEEDGILYELSWYCDNKVVLMKSYQNNQQR